MHDFTKPRVSRSTAATWEMTHRWGAQIGDITTYSVTSTGRHITIRSGNKDITLRTEVGHEHRGPSPAEFVASALRAALEWEPEVSD